MSKDTPFSRSLLIIDDNGTESNIIKQWDPSAKYEYASDSEQFKAKLSKKIDGTMVNTTIQGLPVEFGRMSNYELRRQSVLTSVGYILSFNHTPQYWTNSTAANLAQLDSYLTMPNSYRDKKGQKDNHPFLLIGNVGAGGVETVSKEVVHAWASKHLENFEYIVVDLWPLMTVDERKSQLPPTTNSNTSNPRIYPEVKDRSLEWKSDELQKLAKIERDKISTAIDQLFSRSMSIKADEIVLNDENVSTTTINRKVKVAKKVKKTTPAKKSAISSVAGSFMQSISNFFSSIVIKA